MAGEVQFVDATGGTGRFLVMNSIGQFRSTVTAAFAAFNAGSYADYLHPATEQGATGIYVGDMPAVAAGTYTLIAKRGTAVSDPTVGGGAISWTGTAVAVAGALVTPPETAGRPTALEGMIRRTFERLSNKRTRDRTTGVVTLRNEADTADLETAVQATAGVVDSQTKGA
jgi:hypothetical protein